MRLKLGEERMGPCVLSQGCSRVAVPRNEDLRTSCSTTELAESPRLSPVYQGSTCDALVDMVRRQIR